MEDMDNFWQYTVDNAYIMGTSCGLSYIAYPENLISNMWLNDKSTLIPGAFVYEA